MALADAPSEELVLCCLLRYPSEVGGKCIEAGMSTEWYSQPENQVLYRHLLGVWSEGKPMERYAIAISLKQNGLMEEAGGPDRLLRLFNLQGSVHSVDSYISRVKDCFRRRRLTTATKIAYLDAQGERPVEEIERELHGLLNSADQTVEIVSSSRPDRAGPSGNQRPCNRVAVT